jgi:hypothetical protein
VNDDKHQLAAISLGTYLSSKIEEVKVSVERKTYTKQWSYPKYGMTPRPMQEQAAHRPHNGTVISCLTVYSAFAQSVPRPYRWLPASARQ